MQKYGDSYLKKYQSKSRKIFNSSKESENKKDNSRSSCYNYGKTGHHKPEYPMKKKNNEKGHHKRSSKSRREYVAWESERDSSSDEISTSSEESTFK